MAPEFKKITVRAGGKAHPALQFANGYIMICCRCPGSQNGRLSNVAVKVADGHEAVNCRK